VDATNPAMMVMLCAWCHADLHVRVGGKRKRIDGTTAGADGPLHFWERRGDPFGIEGWVEVT